MNKKVFGLFVFLSACMGTNAQDKTVHVQLKKSRWVLGTQSLGEQGIIVNTGMGKETVYPKRLFYYSAQGDLMWEKEIKTAFVYGADNLVASPHGEWIYFIEFKDQSAKMYSITQIDKRGAEKLFTIEPTKEFGKTPQSAFCDDQYLYFLSTESGNEMSEKRKSTERLFLTRFAHGSQSPKHFVFDLPAVANDPGSSFWSFLGQEGSEKYLVSKSMDRANARGVFSFAVFNEEAVVTRKFSIDFALDGKFTRPAWNVSEPNENIVHTDYETKIVQTAHMSGKISVPTDAAFSFVKLDAGSLYVYGLTGPAPFKKAASVYDGFHLAKYDAEGNVKWKVMQGASKKLMEEGNFRIHAVPSDRSLALTVLPNGSLNFSIQFADKLYDYEFSPEGNLTGSRNRENYYGSNWLFSTSEKLPSDQFILKSLAGKPIKTVGYQNYLLSTGELVLRIDAKPGAFDLYYFKR